MAVLGWAVLIALFYLLFKRDSIGAGILAALVISHWALDAIVHRPDLPLFPGSARVIGLNAWSSLPLTLAIEGTLFAVGVWLYSRATSPKDDMGRWSLLALAVILLGIHAGNLFGAPPPNTEAIAWVGQLQWLLVFFGYWVDKHRNVSAHA